ncbi:MAG TPA: carboxyl transferase domain-containing protein [Mycobacteriales bacterium]|nr:carboxyl transferase domain-containing protein [Mycobacteriales bacterium]
MTDDGVIRPELEKVRERQRMLQDAARPEAVAKVHARGRRTIRENLDDLFDAGSFHEWAGMVVAAQRGRRGFDDLVASTQADGVVTGVGTVDGRRVAVVGYDVMVLAGTQGHFGHKKTDRFLEVVLRERLPLVLFAEGGGGRPGDSDVPTVAGLDVPTFGRFAALSGVVPRIGIASGRCFAGNASLFGLCDITIATPEASIGMAGPAMIEGGGLGVVDADAVGPQEMHVTTGVVDISAADDADAVALTKRALTAFVSELPKWSEPDQLLLRDVVPENRRRAYEVRKVVTLVADEGTVLEVRPRWARGMVTVFARIEGRAIGVIANNPLHLAGAITSECADKATRFLQLCDAFDLPVLSLCDTPGMMVGPAAEQTGLVRHTSRLFTVGATMTAPIVMVILRKGYGLGAMAMAGGDFHAPLTTLAWPTGEVGGMGLEGAVRLAMRKELAAIGDDTERQQAYEALVAAAYERGGALSAATYGEIDDVIDPADTRSRVSALLGAWQPPPRTGRRRVVDNW